MNDFVSKTGKNICRKCGYKRASSQEPICSWCISGIRVPKEERQNVNALFADSLGVMYSGKMVLGKVK